MRLTIFVRPQIHSAELSDNDFLRSIEPSAAQLTGATHRRNSQRNSTTMEPAASSTTTFPLGGGSIYQPLHLQSVPSRPTSARGTPRQSLRLQVRTLEGEAWWLTTDPLSTWLSICLLYTSPSPRDS